MPDMFTDNSDGAAMVDGYQNSFSDTYGFWLIALWVILILIATVTIVDYFLLNKSMLSESGRLNFHHQIASKIDTSSWIQSVFFKMNDYITVVCEVLTLALYQNGPTRLARHHQLITGALFVAALIVLAIFPSFDRRCLGFCKGRMQGDSGSGGCWIHKSDGFVWDSGGYWRYVIVLRHFCMALCWVVWHFEHDGHDWKNKYEYYVVD